MNFKFTISEVITIVMAMLEQLESINEFGVENEVYFPKPINDKLNSIEGEEYDNFISKAYEIADKVYFLKSGELNELNFIHEEVNSLAQELLKEYI
ncbi:hypothetical protein [Clostridium senegalense]|uniref:Uncharacterized protein n=1 Tax=Clostridium senegalense TaxID=1465809 RepID=A0A6M0GZK1_9CLOT|nr:hypothetical protein [Clostridium senegalense]NEU04026.1 hypothetical protein [Clostridium senegalense]